MTYHQYGIISASSYNQFVGLMNNIYGDTNSGSTIESSASFGYGYSNLGTKAVGSVINAADWTSLFNVITLCGTHQGVNVSPIPSSVSSHALIAAYNNYLSTQTLTDVISALTANYLLVNVGQLSAIPTPASAPTSALPWSTGIQYSWQADFGTWDNARHFFNTGSSLTILGSYAGSGSSPVEETFWANLLTGMGTLMFSANATTPGGSGAASSLGFYTLTTSYQEVYHRLPSAGAGVYSNNYISIKAKLNAAAGTNGKIDFQIQLMDNDTHIHTKTGTFTTATGVLQSSGAVPYPGPAVTIPAGSYATIASIPNAGVPLTIVVSPVTSSTHIVGAGVATSVSLGVTAAGGTGPYTYSWTNYLGAVTITTPSASSTTLNTTLTAGQITSGIVKIAVTDSLSVTTFNLVPWSMNSNLTNVAGP